MVIDVCINAKRRRINIRKIVPIINHYINSVVVDQLLLDLLDIYKVPGIVTFAHEDATYYWIGDLSTEQSVIAF